MKKMSEKQYVKEDGCKCPFCRSQQCLTTNTDMDFGVVFHNMICIDCKKEWTEQYNLVGYTEFLENE